MAIIVEESEKKSNLFGIVGWLVFLAIAGAAVYYLFFAQPQLVTIPASGTLGYDRAHRADILATADGGAGSGVFWR